jgi:hypothetical protein
MEAPLKRRIGLILLALAAAAALVAVAGVSTESLRLRWAVLAFGTAMWMGSQGRRWVRVEAA